jgi:AraC-like DNA-binding protein
MKVTTLADFYRETCAPAGDRPGYSLPETLAKEIGHFNVFDIAETSRCYKEKKVMPYNRRTYYKISLMIGHNLVEYADKVIEVKSQGLLFATPRVPYHYVPQDEMQSGYFCVFTDDFLSAHTKLDELPIFKSGGNPVLMVSDTQREEILGIFRKMEQELASDYAYKYDLLRNYLQELIHYGQKLMPATSLQSGASASDRIAALFVELLERQFPVESPRQQLRLRTAKDYADRLAIHVNHLNKVLKETAGQTTTTLIGNRIIREAKILLKQTDWNVSEIAWSLGFEEVAHFSNFFRKQTSLSPMAFRG